MPSEKEETKPNTDNLDVVVSKLGKVDKILTHLKAILKKHWGIILLLLFCAFIYWAFHLPPVQDTPTTPTQTFDSTTTESSSLQPGKIISSDYVDYVQNGIIFKMDRDKLLYYEIDGALYAVYYDQVQNAYYYYDINGQAQWCR